MCKKVFLVLTFFFFFIVSYSYASLITFNFSGPVENVDPLLTSNFSTDDSFSGWITFNSDAPNVYPPDGVAVDTVGHYHAITDMSVTVGTYTAVATQGYIWVENDYGPAGEERDFYSIFLIGTYPPSSTLPPGPLIGAPVNELPLYSFNLSLSDSSYQAFDSILLPTFFDLSDFEGGQLRLQFLDNSTAKGIRTNTFEVSFSQSAEVPEPASILLLGLGLLILTRFNRRHV